MRYEIMRISSLSTLCTFLALLTTACGGGESKPTPEAVAAHDRPAPVKGRFARAAAVPADPTKLDARAVKAAELAKEIEAAPERADALLERADLDREQFEALMLEIAADPVLVEQYRILRGT